MLSAESSAEPGQYHTTRTEYARAIMDAFNDPGVHTVVVMSSAQIAKTTIIENVIGYFIDQDPSPILIMQPTLKMGETFSKNRLAPMLRDTPCLNGIIGDVKSRNSGNEILHKTFTGGHITISGANSPASIAQRPIRIALADDIDRFPVSAGTEGDPVDLLFKRTTAFWNRKKGIFSTPTIKNYSRIEAAYKESDMRKFWVPCPKCGEFQLLSWGQVWWPKTIDNKGNKTHETGKAIYRCEHCEYHITDADKIRMVKSGEWRTKEKKRGIAGFWLNELYSPFVAFQEMADNFIKAVRGGRETLKVFKNTSLGETFEDEGDKVDDNLLMKRREQYGPKIPMKAAVLTGSVDVQKNRLEIMIDAWGIGQERWCMDHVIIAGDTAQFPVWEKLNNYLLKDWEHETGAIMKIVCCSVDHGYRSKEVEEFVFSRRERGIFAYKGKGGQAVPYISNPSLKKQFQKQVKPIIVGTDTAKDTLYSRLEIEEFGAGYHHFSIDREDEFFLQLTSEEKRTKYIDQKPIRYYYQTRARNEALDLCVMSMVALTVYFGANAINSNLEALVNNLAEYEEQKKEPLKPQQKPRKRTHRVLHPGY